MASSKKRHRDAGSRLIQLEESIGEAVPSFAAFLSDEQDFREVRFKLKDDGTLLVILKGYFSDGGPSVCFAVGYGFSGALLAVDSVIQGGHWKVDKPWQPK